MRYKIISSNSKEGVCVREDEIDDVLEGMQKGGIIIVREGIINPSFIVKVVEDNERMRDLAEAKRGNYKFEEPSPFAHLLRDRLKMLSPDKRDAAMVEASAEERKNN